MKQETLLRIIFIIVTITIMFLVFYTIYTGEIEGKIKDDLCKRLGYDEYDYVIGERYCINDTDVQEVFVTGSFKNIKMRIIK